jgi:hypothetical protein
MVALLEMAELHTELRRRLVQLRRCRRTWWKRREKGNKQVAGYRKGRCFSHGVPPTDASPSISLPCAFCYRTMIKFALSSTSLKVQYHDRLPKAYAMSFECATCLSQSGARSLKPSKHLSSLLLESKGEFVAMMPKEKC